MWESATGAAELPTAHLARLQMPSGQLMVVQNTDYFNAVFGFPVVDNMAQSRVLSVACPHIFAALAKPGIAGQKVERGCQIVNVSFGLFVAPQ